MASKLLIDAHYEEEIRVAMLDDDGKLEAFESEHLGKKLIKGNIYLAKVVRIEPSIQAAFIDYGENKHGFLPLSEIHKDYYNKNIAKTAEQNEQASGKKKQSKHFKIQEVISPKQIILVQAQKEPRGNKCAYFSTYVSLPGRYCVLFPNPAKASVAGVSKKIESTEKERLKNIISPITPEGMGSVVRTAGENRTKQEIKRDMEYLIRLWNEIRENVSSATAPAIIYEEGNIIKRTIRDLYNRNSDKIFVQGQAAYKEARTFMKIFTPSHVKKIELYKDDAVNVFQKYSVEDRIYEILNPTVVLPSGGTIVINQTEALTAIDVNSGKLKTERSIEETALKTNLEAVSEIVRQMKLRDIAGIIVIDFIDMDEKTSNAKVEKAFKDAIKYDYSSIQVGRISQFGLLELSRQRRHPSLSDSNFCVCQYCNGSGKILANESSALLIIRKIENFVVDNKPKSVLVEVANGMDLFILNSKRKLIQMIENENNVFIEITRNSTLTTNDCKIVVKEYHETEVATAKPEKQAEKQKAEPEQKKPVNKKEPKGEEKKITEQAQPKAEKPEKKPEQIQKKPKKFGKRPAQKVQETKEKSEPAPASTQKEQEQTPKAEPEPKKPVNKKEQKGEEEKKTAEQAQSKAEKPEKKSEQVQKKPKKFGKRPAQKVQETKEKSEPAPASTQKEQGQTPKAEPEQKKSVNKKEQKGEEKKTTEQAQPNAEKPEKKPEQVQKKTKKFGKRPAQKVQETKEKSEPAPASTQKEQGQTPKAEPEPKKPVKTKKSTWLKKMFG